MSEKTLADLVGEHLLDAVDTEKITVEPWEGAGYTEDVEAFSFRLDGKVYTALEDPDDGYRSSMDKIVESERPMRNVFAPVKVVGRHRTEGDHQRDNVLELIDVVTGKVVLEVGTANTDDYYPWWVATFDPTAMATNASSAPEARAEETPRAERNGDNDERA